MEEYKLHANDLKDRGNDAFKAGDTAKAIDFYSQAIEISPDDHLLYSNRSAAYIKMDFISKSLKDAEKAVELCPTWSKGYVRLGTAQQGLKRMEAALASFKKAFELDEDSGIAKKAIQKCECLIEAERSATFAAAEAERKRVESETKAMDAFKAKAYARAGGDKDVQERHTAENGCGGGWDGEERVGDTSGPAPDEDDPLAGFFGEVRKESEDVREKRLQRLQEARKETIFHEKYLLQNLGSGKEQHARLTANNWQYRNLNPYYVLQLGTDATEEDIKNRYRKLSAKVHPDKNRGVDNARDSFEEVKKAYNKLMDETQRRNVIDNIDMVTQQTRERLSKEWKNKGGGESFSEEELEEEVSKALMRHFAEMEVHRQRSDALVRKNNLREKAKEMEKEEGDKEYFREQKAWNDEKGSEARVGGWRDFAQGGGQRVKKRGESFRAEAGLVGQRTEEQPDWKKQRK